MVFTTSLQDGKHDNGDRVDENNGEDRRSCDKLTLR
jgi:hypothetical protein